MNINRPIILGSYSPSQNGIIVHQKGIALCLCGGTRGMMQINRKYCWNMNKAIIDKGIIPSPEEEEDDDPNDMPPLVLIEYD